MAGNQDRAAGPPGPDPQQGSASPAETARGSEPAGPPVKVPELVAAWQRAGPVKGRLVGLIFTVAAAAAVAIGVVVGRAQHAAPFNVLLFLLVIAADGAELVIRRRSAGQGGGATDRAAGPAAPAVKPAAKIVSVVAVCAVGGVMGMFSLLAALVADSCSSNQCYNTLNLAWPALILTQALIVVSAIAGTASARTNGQLARGVLLGIAGPFLALAAFAATLSAYVST